MAEFLSQDEIDALLDIAEQGEDIETPIERVISKEKNYSIGHSFIPSNNRNSITVSC